MKMQTDDRVLHFVEGFLMLFKVLLLIVFVVIMVSMF